LTTAFKRRRLDKNEMGKMLSVKMKIMIQLLIALLFGFSLTQAQNNVEVLPVKEILHRADSVAVYQDSLLAHSSYEAKKEYIINELTDKGMIKNSDTVISNVNIANKKEVVREVIYSSMKSKSAENKEQKQEVGFSFSFSDPDYNFSLTETSDSSYIIAVSPKGTPKKSEYHGTIEIDRRGFFYKSADLELLKPEGALKEFSTQMSFEPLEGGLVVIREMKMKGLVKAFLGIFKMRFSGEVRYSNYEFLK
jgi:hypothetical protein